MEFIGMLFIIMFFTVLGTIPVVLLFGLLGVIGIVKMVPDELTPLLKPILGCVLIVVSLAFLLTI